MFICSRQIYLLIHHVNITKKANFSNVLTIVFSHRTQRNALPRGVNRCGQKKKIFMNKA